MCCCEWVFILCCSSYHLCAVECAYAGCVRFGVVVLYILGNYFGIFSYLVALCSLYGLFLGKDKEFSNSPLFSLKESQNIVCYAHLIAVLAICSMLLFPIFLISSIFLHAQVVWDKINMVVFKHAFFAILG